MIISNQLPDRQMDFQPHLSEKQMKDNFMVALGLVTRKALDELQSRKCERKQRTTANPQFSNAALKAKRINKMELAEKRAKRKFLLANNAKPAKNGNNATKEVAKNTKSVTESNVSVAKEEVTPEIKLPVGVQIESREVSSGAYFVTNISSTFQSPNCVVCDELCECDIEAILYCKFCQKLFHGTCAVTLNYVIKNQSIPCPNCTKKKEEYLSKKQQEAEKLKQKQQSLDSQMMGMQDMLKSLSEKLKQQQVEKNTLKSKKKEVEEKLAKLNLVCSTIKERSEVIEASENLLNVLAESDSNKNEQLENNINGIESANVTNSNLPKNGSDAKNGTAMENHNNDVEMCDVDNSSDLNDAYVDVIVEDIVIYNEFDENLSNEVTVDNNE